MTYLDERPLQVTGHAQQRFVEVYGRGSRADVAKAFSTAERIDPALVWALTQRQGEADPRDSFWMSPDFLGIFVLVEHPQEVYLKTFLRLSPAQQHIARGGRAETLGLAPARRPLRPDTEQYLRDVKSMDASLTPGSPALTHKAIRRLLQRIAELCTYLDQLDPRP